MIYENVELHNVAETRPANGGARLQRVPEDIRKQLNEGAQLATLQPDNCEVRFVSDSAEAAVTLSSEGETDATLFFGAFDGRERYVIGPKPTTIRFTPQDRLQKIDRQWWENLHFAPRVRRIVFGGRRRDPVIFHGVEGEGIRPPSPGDQPVINYLAYGTSITQGVDCEGPHLNYIAQTAWHLKADLINLGVAGSCHCEPAFADYIAGRSDWHIATLALSVNMHGFPLDEFRRRIDYMVNTVAAADTNRPVVCITLFPYFRDFGFRDFGWADPGAEYGGTPEEYRQSLREVVAECPLPNVHLIEGTDILTDIGGLTADLIHPSDNGMIEMGRNLSARLKPLLA